MQKNSESAYYESIRFIANFFAFFIAIGIVAAVYHITILSPQKVKEIQSVRVVDKRANLKSFMGIKKDELILIVKVRNGSLVTLLVDNDADLAIGVGDTVRTVFYWLDGNTIEALKKKYRLSDFEILP